MEGGYELLPEDIPHNVEDVVQRWKLKLKLSVAILKKVLVEGDGSVGPELFQALSAVNMNEKVKLSGDGEVTKDDSQLLTYLIQNLKGDEADEQVEDGSKPHEMANVESLVL
jgi:hypothetical protein